MANKTHYAYDIGTFNYQSISSNASLSGTAVFWVIGASLFIIGLHASFYNFDALDLPLDDTQKLTGQIIEEV